jgi:hypothetical protein
VPGAEVLLSGMMQSKFSLSIALGQKLTLSQHWTVLPLPNGRQGQNVCRQDHQQDWPKGLLDLAFR